MTDYGHDEAMRDLLVVWDIDNDYTYDVGEYGVQAYRDLRAYIERLEVDLREVYGAYDDLVRDYQALQAQVTA